ncbi:YifB family Mg chelatase-like AAA ATPase [Bermanella marisrubri]|uniref:Mg chelatase-related protein n=1 Tax=Bermanella marisrubri TaxID=207949 RepID=Q1MXV5_9GAMM|nr:YifB family Mg chelatase-like AAA ATPase [Bermanella marisrubri]EAT10823.1 Mg chelatase-related protein [Oceanobacter sp. RED65] [Bermanella marisrubri]QIZ85673.1 YifB family Mg chelatase-like AAA ATPase [Bermanella marisrubri]
MSLAVVHARAKVGIDAPLVQVETHLSNGLPSFSIVGLPETAVKESKDRVRSAILNAGFEFPAMRITVNLAPADLPKEGGRFDLAIALGILTASEQLSEGCLADYECIGELALTAAIRPVQGIIPAALAARKAGKKLILPQANAEEASLCPGELLVSEHLLEVCEMLQGNRKLARVEHRPLVNEPYHGPDLKQVKGQQQAKHALEIAAAGGHNLLMSGPPGTGKSMLAQCLPGILPPLTLEEALEVASLYSISRQPTRPYFSTRPFRQPHHTCSGVALVGGGTHPKPGEISLAHKGILFLDEVPEYSRKVLDVMREPLETGHVSISRAAAQITYPAEFQLIAAMNPCPCGYLNIPNKRCGDCSEAKAQRYQSAVSGPLLDRIDLQLEVPALPKGLLSSDNSEAESSAQVKERVTTARSIQYQRQGCVNAKLEQKAIQEFCPLSKELSQLLENAMEKLGLSARAYHRIIKVARTIADLQHSPAIEKPHLLEALSFRQLERRLN